MSEYRPPSGEARKDFIIDRADEIEEELKEVYIDPLLTAVVNALCTKGDGSIELDINYILNDILKKLEES